MSCTYCTIDGHDYVPRRISRRESALRAGVSLPTLDKLIKEGHLPAHRVDGTRSVVIDERDVEALLIPVAIFKESA